MANRLNKKRGKKEIVINILYQGVIDLHKPASVAAEILNTTQRISKAGFRFRIICDEETKKTGDNSFSIEEGNGKVAIHRFPYSKLKRNRRLHKWGLIFWAANLAARKRVTLNHVYVLPELELFARLFSPRTKNIFHVQSFPGSWHGNRWLLAMKDSDLIISVSEFIKQKLIEKYPFICEKVVILPNGADTTIFHPKRKFDLRKQLGLEKKDFLVIFSGNIWREKGFHIVLKAAQILFDRDKEIVFLVAGGLQPKENPLHKIWKAESPKNIKYLGFLPHIMLGRYYASADISIVPSLWEDPCPLVVFEALASGTPVIASRIGGIPEFIDDGSDGFLISPGSISELVNRIIWCKSNRGRLNVMGKEARKKGIKYDWEMISDQLKKIYFDLIDSGKKI